METTVRLNVEDRIKEMQKLNRSGPNIAQELQKENYSFSETVSALVVFGYEIWFEKSDGCSCLYVSQRPYQDRFDFIKNRPLVSPLPITWFA